MEIEDSHCNSAANELARFRKSIQIDNDSSCSDEDEIKKKQQRIYNLMDFYKQRNEKYKKIEFNLANIERFILPEKEFYIFGDMIVEDFLDKSEPSQIVRASNWQCWRRAIKVQFKRDIQSLEITNENTAIGLCEMNHVVKMLQSKGDQQLYKLSCLLNNYQKVVDIILGISSEIRSYLKVYPNIIDLQDQVFQQWLEECYKWIKKNMKQGEIYTYEIGRIDFQKLEHMEYMFGMSKPLLDILGTDENTAVNIALRFGRIEFFTEETRYYNITQKLLFALTQSRDPDRIIKYDIITLDGIVIPVQAKIESPIIPTSKEIPGLSEQPFYKAFAQVLTIVKYQIDDRYIESIKKTRSQQQNQKYYDEDFSYTMESTLLLEKFYQNEYQKHLKNSDKDIKRCFFADL